MEKMIDDLRSIININSVCEKDLSSAYPFSSDLVASFINNNIIY